MAHISTTPMKPGAANSAYGMVESFYKNKEAFADIAKKVVALCRKNFRKTNLTPGEQAQFKEMVAVELAKEKERFFALIDEAEAAASPPQTIPAPPPSKELYGRIADGQSITDVGSGNCLRLQADSGRLKITAIDPEINEQVPVTIKKIKREVTNDDLSGDVVTSFNAVCAMAPGPVRDAVLEQDGMHVVPDHDELLEMDCAQVEGDKIRVFVPNGEYLDTPVQQPGYKICTGYKLVSTFAAREISLRSPDDFDSAGIDTYRPHIDCSPCSPVDIDWSDMGWKWDGVPLEFEICNTRATVTRRDGAYYEAQVTGESGVDMSLHAEWIKDKDKLVLLRIECYRGYVPPHCGTVLREFCKAVDFAWNGIRLEGPPEMDLAVGPVLGGVLCPVDGVITRNHQRDYYVKPYWTLDLRPPNVEAVGSRLAELGKVLEPVDAKPGLWEYKVVKEGERYQLIPSRERLDKVSTTPAGTIEYLLSLPTIREMVAVTGRSPDVEGLVGYFMEI